MCHGLRYSYQGGMGKMSSQEEMADNYYRRLREEAEKLQAQTEQRNIRPQDSARFRRNLEYADVKPIGIVYKNVKDHLIALHSCMDVALLAGDVEWAELLHTKITQIEGAN